VNKNNSVSGLGVASTEDRVFMYLRETRKRGATLQIRESTGGLTFGETAHLAKIKDGKGFSEKIANASDFRISKLDNGKFFLTYKLTSKKHTPLFGAVSENLTDWQKTAEIGPVEECGMVIPEYTYNEQSVLIYGEKRFKIAFSKDLVNWEVSQNPVLRFSTSFSQNHRLKIGLLEVKDEGILLTYCVWQVGKDGKQSEFQVKLALLDRQNPAKILWKGSRPIWEEPETWKEKGITPLGIISFKGQLISYWEVTGSGIFSVKHYQTVPSGKVGAGTFLPSLKRFDKNPILAPIAANSWESQAVFNPAATITGGKVHLIYRAVGNNAVSVFGHAESADGIHINARSDKPIYAPSEPFESNLKAPAAASPQFASGCGVGGCEDPRITKIDGRLYVTYTAWNGQQAPRVALTSISESDFEKGDWNWKTPVLISPPNPKNADGVNKNWVIFPEKINGKYAILHSLSPDILVDYFDDLNFDGKTFIDSYSDSFVNHKKDRWGMKIKGAGPPPLKTNDGWLVFYRAATNTCGYTIGAMLLDGNDPTKVLYSSTNPILTPETWYENEGIKPRIVYSCGAVVIDDRLHLYYGSSDQYTCVATAPLDKFLNKLETTGSPQLEPAKALNFQYN
jgi:predicted GH43/DUF377 family glycosyl hydrolase